MYGEGISHEGCLVDLGVLTTSLVRAARGTPMGTNVLVRAVKTRKSFKNQPEMALKLKNRIREAAGLTALEAAPQTEDILKPEGDPDRGKPKKMPHLCRRL